MKSQLCSVLFAMVVSVSACGGDRREPTSTEPTPVSALTPSTQPALDEPTVEPGKPVSESPILEVEVPKTYADALARGKALVDKGEHGKARDVLALAAKLDKKQSDPHIELARSYIATNERANAIKSASKAVKLAPESSQAYNTLGRAELLRHDYDGAIIAFRQATELNPDNVWAWNNLGYTFLMLKQYQDAADALVEATSRKGTTGYMWNNLGTALEHLDELDDAREAYENGGKLGSAPALASRKRLEGVDTIVVINDKPAVTDEVTDKIDDASDDKIEHGYDNAEPMPEPIVDEVTDAANDDADDDADDEPIVEPEVEASGVDVVEPALDVEGEVHAEEPKPAPGVL